MKKILVIICSIFILFLGFLITYYINNKKESEEKMFSESYQEKNKIIMDNNGKDKLLYQGKASIRIVTQEGKVIYIDPFMGDGYNLSADLVLITHEHFDHNNINKITSKNNDCKIIRSTDSIVNDEHQIFDLGYAKVEAVEAGYNKYHDVKECVGYIITLSSGITIYVTGDTSITKQMPELAEKNIDYAFYCCDGIYNMGLEEAIRATKMVNAKHSIPYHMTGSTTNALDENKAEKFNVDGKLILKPGQEIVLENEIETNAEINNSYRASEEDIVLNRYKEMQQAMIDKNEIILNEIIENGTTFTHMSGKTQSKEEYIADIINKKLDYQAYKIENPKITIDGNKAIIKAKVSLTANAYGAQGTWPFDTTAYLEKIDGKWYYRNKF